MAGLRRLFTSLYLVIGIGATWAAMVSDRVSYPGWAMVGPAEFGAFHHAMLAGTRIYLLPPALLSLVMTIGMFWLRMPSISRLLVGVVLVCQLIGAFATVRLAIPIQMQMLHGPASGIPRGIARLIAIDLHWRIVPGLVILIALAAMVYQSSGSRRR